ncbi:thiol peroxidase [Deferrisoma camini]|uniref:thiol peroxidase n=1 Tax=Deferrisoma camini TaxID=1035120 RepID=UPI00046D2552|nr:thiol peroxidase [Deferrisoma camini]
MDRRKGIVTLAGNPMTLLGPELKPGDPAPAFTVVDADLKPVGLGDLGGGVRLLSAVPSLDTPVCELQTKRFHQEAAALPPEVTIATISMDLPFAQKRFCATHGIDRIRVLSDYKDASFGLAYGVLIEEVRLLARSIFVIGPDDVVRYVEIVPEVGTHPDYDRALAAVRSLAG